VIVTYKRKPILITKIDLLREAFKNAKQFFNFEIFGVCVLSDYIHLILKPETIEEYPKIVTLIKYYFSHRFNDVGVETPTYQGTYGYKNKLEKGILQRRYWEHTIRA
jgi:REP element-mobilizing transposase RayT